MEILFSREIRLWENWGKKLATIILNLFPYPRKWTRPMNFSHSVRGIKFYPPLSFRDDTVERIMNEAPSSQNRIWSANRITNIPSSHPPPHLVVNQYQCAGCASEKNLRFGHFPREERQIFEPRSRNHSTPFIICPWYVPFHLSPLCLCRIDDDMYGEM